MYTEQFFEINLFKEKKTHFKWEVYRIEFNIFYPTNCTGIKYVHKFYNDMSVYDTLER